MISLITMAHDALAARGQRGAGSRISRPEIELSLRGRLFAPSGQLNLRPGERDGRDETREMELAWASRTPTLNRRSEPRGRNRIRIYCPPPLPLPPPPSSPAKLVRGSPATEQRLRRARINEAIAPLLTRRRPQQSLPARRSNLTARAALPTSESRLRVHTFVSGLSGRRVMRKLIDGAEEPASSNKLLPRPCRCGFQRPTGQSASAAARLKQYQRAEVPPACK